MKCNAIFVQLLLINCVQAQVTFQNSYSGAGTNHFAIETSDGNIVIAGDNFGYGFTVIKADSNGSSLWGYSYIDSLIPFYDAFSIVEVPGNGYVIAGDFEAGFLDQDFYLIRIDNNGMLLWAKTYGRYVGTHDYYGHVIRTFDGGFVLYGWSSVNSPDVFVLKLDSAGAIQWSKIYTTTDIEEYPSIEQTSDSGYIISSSSYLIKTNENGNISWAKSISNTSCYSVIQTSDGGYALGCATDSLDELNIVKTDSSGNLIWSKHYEKIIPGYGIFIIESTDGGYGIAGTTEDLGFGEEDFYFVRTDTSGGILWSKAYGATGHEACKSLVETSDNGFLLSGGSNSFAFTYLIKTDSSGSSGCNDSTIMSIENNANVVLAPVAISNSSGGFETPSLTIVDTLSITDNILCFSSTTEIANVNQENRLILFPNPANSTVSIQLPASDAFLEIVDCSGIVRFRKCGSDVLQIDVSSFYSGIYFAKVYSGDHVYVEKLVVSN